MQTVNDLLRKGEVLALLGGCKIWRVIQHCRVETFDRKKFTRMDYKRFVIFFVVASRYNSVNS